MRKELGIFWADKKEIADFLAEEKIVGPVCTEELSGHSNWRLGFDIMIEKVTQRAKKINCDIVYKHPIDWHIGGSAEGTFEFYSFNKNKRSIYRGFMGNRH